MALIRLTVVMIILMPAAFRLQAAMIEGRFSDWYYVGSGVMSIDYHFSKVELEKGDPSVGASNKVICEPHRCGLEVFYINGSYVYLEKIPISNVSVDLDTFNRLLRDKLPLSGIGKVRIPVGRQICIRVELAANWSTEIANTCKGSGPPLPPTPSVPVSCTVDVNSSVVDFGTISPVESPRKNITASFSCIGDKEAEGSALLKLVGMDATQENYAILYNDVSSESIRVRLSIGNTTTNSEKVTVKSGLNGSRSLNFDINSSELTGKTGSFNGSAVLSFTVL